MNALLSAAICLFLMLSATALFAAPPVRLSVEQLRDPDAQECPICRKPIKAGQIGQDAVNGVIAEAGQYMEEKKIPHEGPAGLNIFIYRFMERVGGKAGVEKPASVAFHAHLMDGKRVVRTIVFDETQQPLSENLLALPTFVKRGAKWLTAEELAREGVRKVIDSFRDALLQDK